MASEDLKGYDYKFVDPVPDFLICLICTCVARDPQQTMCCGRIYCSQCLSDLRSSCEVARCPQCRKEPISSFPDTRGDRDVKSLMVYCDNKEDGCKWIGELRLLEAHLTRCDFTFVPCPNKCEDFHGKVVRMLAKELRKHTAKCPRRPFECRHCKEVGAYLDITNIHVHRCPNLRVACPNSSCRKRIIRRDLTSHRRECPFEEIPCKYARIGCNARVPRKDREEHESDAEQHLQLAINTVSELKSKLDQQQTVIFMLRNFEQLKSNNKPVSSQLFYTGPGGYKICVQVLANGWHVFAGSHISVYAYVLRGGNDASLSWPFIGTVVVELLNQLEDANHYSRCLTFHDKRERSKGVHSVKQCSDDTCLGYITHSALGYDAAKNCQYLKDDCLCFRLRAEAPSPIPWLNY